MLVRFMESLLRELPCAAVLICGDFNSEPRSGVCKMLRHAKLRPPHPDLVPKPERTVRPLARLAQGFSHSLRLESAYCSLAERRILFFKDNSEHADGECRRPASI